MDMSKISDMEDDLAIPTGFILIENFQQVLNVMSELIEKIQRTEELIYSSLEQSAPRDKAGIGSNLGMPGTSPIVNKWVRLTALHSLFYRTLTMNAPSEDDIISLAVGIQSSRIRKGIEDAQRFEDQVVAMTTGEPCEDTEEESVPAPTRRKRTVN